ncbi:MAG: hypothetical protein HY543_09990 [Deltaproteobacteria bacterium]|nr:hypothetical protein [Deltaproteobacteria bacterium]
MAKRKRAPARRTRIPASRTSVAARRPRVPAHRTYTPELLANGRHRYERTAEAVAAIAADFRIHPGSLRRLAYRLGWVRHNMGPRELPSAARLLAQADALEAAQVVGDATAAPASRAEKGEELAAPPDKDPSGAPTAIFDTSAIARLEAQVMEELATVEAMRAQLKGLPRRPREAEATARTLSTLTDTLQKLQRLRCAVPFSGPGDDDMPADIDEFRIDLARRIDAFVASRTEPGEADGRE